MNSTAPAPVPRPAPASAVNAGDAAAALNGPAAAPAPRPSAVDASRRYGAHLRMAWWKPLVIIVPMGVIMLLAQIVLMTVAMFVEIMALGRDPQDFLSIGPLGLLALNLSLVVAAVVGLLLTRFVGRVPLRSVLSHPRAFSWGRLGLYAAAFVLPLGLVVGGTSLLDPSVQITVTGTTIALVVVALLSTPLQAAAEELMFRGVMTPAIASWIRPERLALAVGIILSSIVFGLSHGAGDLWLMAYYVAFGLCGALMALISRGLEAPIAFHVVNNLLAMVLGALMTGGGGVVIDRSAGAGGPIMLLMIGVDLLLVGIVWLLERRRSRVERSTQIPTEQVRSGLESLPTV
ncbi:CPBP family intramembrane glutamic endopeptidase [Brachybacterium sp. J153]|uniref:CPBP family intramembrane glutamic endopeptidase n=1 Tax=Brachybacterium sp. J153 TaxID=3116488 RepID=UPI002E7A23B2|nr:type II CAAX endopeptidase family protein [Brachybacterium sp. J153]MEE1617444.1 type II CAAX endopeptidase family protein [Brachybacterium sp. J153]